MINVCVFHKKHSMTAAGCEEAGRRLESPGWTEVNPPSLQSAVKWSLQRGFRRSPSADENTPPTTGSLKSSRGKRHTCKQRAIDVIFSRIID
jgi:hypothetical protein